MRGKWRRRLPGPNIMMAEGTQKARRKEKRTVEINDPSIVEPKETCPFTLDGMARLPSSGDSCWVSLTNRGHVEAKRESILCSGASTERPLVLSSNEGEPSSRMSCIAPQNSNNRRLAAQALSSALERATKMSLFRSRFSNDHATNGTLTEKFVAWRESASGAVESIRKRIGGFRRARSLDVDLEAKSYGNEHPGTLNKARSKHTPASATNAEQKLEEKVPFIKSTDRITLSRNNDESKIALLNKQELPEAHVNRKNEVSNVESRLCDPLDNGQYVCGTCVLGNGTDIEPLVINNDPGSITIPRVEPESENPNNAVVQKQPVTTPPENSDPNSDIQAESLPKNPSTSNDPSPNGETVADIAQPPSLVVMQQNAVGEQQEEDQVSMENKGVPRKCISGVNLWDLRNSLEHTTIELKCINFSQEERTAETGAEKQSTREIAESSPRSTPSSDFFISRDKSMTDSEDGGNDNNTIDASIDLTLPGDSSGSSAAQSKRNRPLLEGQIVQENITSASTSLSGFRQPKGNVVITHAVIERSPDNQDAKNRSSTKLAAASERRRNFGVSKQNSLFDSNDSDVFMPERPVDERGPICHSGSPRRASLRVGRETRTPSSESSTSDRDGRKLYNIIRFVDDGQSIEFENGNNAKTRRKNSASFRTTVSRRSPTFSPSTSCSSSIQTRNESEKDSSVATSPSPLCSPPTTTSMDSIVSSTSSSQSNTHPSNETSHLPTTARYRTSPRCKFQTKPGSSTSSATTSPSSPTGVWPHSSHVQRTRSGSEISETDSMDSYSHSSSRSSSSLRGLSRLFRRSSTQKHQHESIPTFCGYTMGRDYCVDVETDRIFKEFLCQDGTSDVTGSEPLPPPSHMLPPRPLNRSNATQLRRQVMRKQYSDSIAMYYGQRMRRWRFAKQKSDSVNCPVDRCILRRQDKIEEEFDPEEINERLSSTSSRRDSDRPDFVPLTVNELMEWRRSSQDYTSSHSNSLEEGSKMRRRVTFRSSKSEC